MGNIVPDRHLDGDRIPGVATDGAPRYPHTAHPGLVEIFERIRAQTRCQFTPATFGEQQIAWMPGGPMCADGSALLRAADVRAQQASSNTDLLGAIHHFPSHTQRHDGRPILAMTARVDDNTALILEIGFTNIVLPNRPSFSLSVASRLGFGMDDVTHIIGDANPQWTMQLVGGPDISFLQRPNARLALSPQSLDESIGIIARLMQRSSPPPLA